MYSLSEEKVRTFECVLKKVPGRTNKHAIGCCLVTHPVTVNTPLTAFQLFFTHYSIYHIYYFIYHPFIYLYLYVCMQTITKLLLPPSRKDSWVILADKVSTDPHSKIYSRHQQTIQVSLGRTRSHLRHYLGRTVAELRRSFGMRNQTDAYWSRIVCANLNK